MSNPSQTITSILANAAADTEAPGALNDARYYSGYAQVASKIQVAGLAEHSDTDAAFEADRGNLVSARMYTRRAELARAWLTIRGAA